MKIRCEGGMLDGKEVEARPAEERIHQAGMTTLRVHTRYPKQPGWKTTTRLLTYWESYTLHLTDDGPVYRCVAPFTGHVTVNPFNSVVASNGVGLTQGKGGGFDVWINPDGTVSALPPE